MHFWAMGYSMVSLRRIGFLIPPGTNQAKMGPNCADDAGVRARAPVQQHHLRYWDPFAGRFQFPNRSPDQEHQQGWGGLGFDMMAAARPALAARP